MLCGTDNGYYANAQSTDDVRVLASVSFVTSVKQSRQTWMETDLWLGAWLHIA